MDIPDLSQLSAEQQEALGEMADKSDPSLHVRTAFMVVVDENGEVFAHADLSTPITRAYAPSPDDIYGACAVVQRDITVQMGAQQTVVGMQHMARVQAQRFQEAQMLQGMDLKGK